MEMSNLNRPSTHYAWMLLDGPINIVPIIRALTDISIRFVSPKRFSVEAAQKVCACTKKKLIHWTKWILRVHGAVSFRLNNFRFLYR